jgi:hypothetical protein
MVYHLNRKLTHFHFHACGKQNNLKIKSKPIDLAIGENALRRLSAKRLTAALRIGQAKSANKTQHLDVRLGGKLPDPSIALISVLAEISRPYEKIQIGLVRHLVGKPSDHLGAVSQIRIGEHDHIALCGKNSLSHRASLSSVIGIAHNANMGQGQCANDIR